MQRPIVSTRGREEEVSVGKRSGPRMFIALRRVKEKAGRLDVIREDLEQRKVFQVILRHTEVVNKAALVRGPAFRSHSQKGDPTRGQRC